MTMFSWGLNFVAVKKVNMAGMSPAALSLSRALLMLVILLPIAIGYREKLKFESWNEAWKILGLGALSLGIYIILFLEGLSRVTPPEGAILMATAPIWALFFEAAFGMEKLRLPSLLGAILAFVGVGVVVSPSITHGGKDTKLGVILVLVGAMCWALSAIASRVLVKGVSPLRMLTLSMPGGILLLLPYSLHATLNAPWSSFTFEWWGWYSWVVVLSGVFGFLWFYTGVRQCGAGGAMLYQFLVPPLATLFSFIVLGTTIYPIQALGLVMVLTGVYFAIRDKTLATREV
jgi:drug/metabolite transporter (DMT)-like permease